MKIFKITLVIVTMFIVSCANKPVSSKILELAKPKPSPKPAIEKTESKVEKVVVTRVEIVKEVNNADDRVKDLEDQLTLGKSINDEFSKAIESLSDEHFDVMNDLNKRFAKLGDEATKTISELKSNLAESLDLLDKQESELIDVTRELSVNKIETKILMDELEFYVGAYDYVVDSAKNDEVYKDKAQSRLKYVWMFWTLLVAVVAFILLRIK